MSIRLTMSQTSIEELFQPLEQEMRSSEVLETVRKIRTHLSRPNARLDDHKYVRERLPKLLEFIEGDDEVIERF